MGYSRYIGYVGALAVALGVGVATTPGIAYGLPAESGQESPTTGESSTTPPSSSPSTANSLTTTPSPTIKGDGAPSNRLSGNDLRSALSDLPSHLAGAVSKVLGGRDGAPVVVLRSSGGAQTATKNVRDAKESAVNAFTAVSKLPSVDTVDREESSRLAQQDGERSRQQVQSGVPATGQSSRSVGQAARTLSFATAAISSQVNPAVAPPTAVVPAPPPDLEDILEEPHTQLVGVVAHVADAVLEVLLTPFGPGSPAQSPMLWSVLAFVRDEFQRPFIPQGASGQTTTSLNQSPNLLVNPGAEAGDPSLSGYASVTVPGWTQTGTPTVIKYGTLRRFPVPTAIAGPGAPQPSGIPEQGRRHPHACGGTAVLRRRTRRGFDPHPDSRPSRCRRR